MLFHFGNRSQKLCLTEHALYSVYMYYRYSTYDI